MKNQERDFTSRAKLSTIGRLDCKIFGSMLQHCVMTTSNKFSHPTHPMAYSPHKLIFFLMVFIYHKIITFFPLHFSEFHDLHH